jgi:hypothetical protein
VLGTAQNPLCRLAPVTSAASQAHPALVNQKLWGWAGHMLLGPLCSRHQRRSPGIHEGEDGVGGLRKLGRDSLPEEGDPYFHMGESHPWEVGQDLVDTTFWGPPGQ